MQIENDPSRQSRGRKFSEWLKKHAPGAGTLSLSSLFMFVLYEIAGYPPPRIDFSRPDIKGMMFFAYLVLTAICLGIWAQSFFPSFFNSLVQGVRSENEGAPTNAEDSWGSVFRRATATCDRLAEHHDRKSVVFLFMGVAAATIGIAFYIYSLLLLGQQDALDQEVKNARKSFDVDIVNLNRKMERTSELVLGLRIELIDADGRPGPEFADLSKAMEISDYFSMQEEFMKDLTQRAEESRKSFDDNTSKLIQSREQFSWHKDLLPALRNTTAFLFVELVAGLFFAISRRNELNASSWRAHRQVYDRLLAVPSMVQELKSELSTDAERAWLIHLLTPVPLPPTDNAQDHNPSIDMIKAVAEALSTVQKPRGSPPTS